MSDSSKALALAKKGGALALKSKAGKQLVGKVTAALGPEKTKMAMLAARKGAGIAKDIRAAGGVKNYAKKNKSAIKKAAFKGADFLLDKAQEKFA